MISEVQVRLSGGIGNQIFQYFAGKMVAEKFSSTFSINANLLYGFNAHFGSDIRELAFYKPDNEVAKVLITTTSSLKAGFRIKLAKKNLCLSRLFKVYSKEQIDFNAIGKFKGEVELSGYFQTRQVVEFIKEGYPELDLLPKKESPSIAAAMQAIGNNFCAIHIRRGDYLKSGSIHNVLNSDYYSNALSILTDKRKKDPIKYVVFSDEPKHVASLLPENVNYIEANQFKLSTVEELYLMSQANAFIIANSTFSFWPAFLARIECVVVAPNRWFKSGDQSINEIFPSHWNLITN